MYGIQILINLKTEQKIKGKFDRNSRFFKSIHVRYDINIFENIKDFAYQTLPFMNVYSEYCMRIQSRLEF